MACHAFHSVLIQSSFLFLDILAYREWNNFPSSHFFSKDVNVVFEIRLTKSAFKEDGFEAVPDDWFKWILNA